VDLFVPERVLEVVSRYKIIIGEMHGIISIQGTALAFFISIKVINRQLGRESVQSSCHSLLWNISFDAMLSERLLYFNLHNTQPFQISVFCRVLFRPQPA
jgi:hypothetical protein